ncbi:Transport protein particle (TRAPP) component like protein [Aduncisulcus paluster]|uniref:Transport protein particle (TRAPP) component like protein n=1 Tax=Aduncisulcus paluster TaxID=2918883 RepID=A0ABQ5JUZ2_9EUKA|nr:Transport protein particle (TRAPP) component like protein [Aduncisulcus paluster]
MPPSDFFSDKKDKKKQETYVSANAFIMLFNEYIPYKNKISRRGKTTSNLKELGERIGPKMFELQAFRKKPKQRFRDMKVLLQFIVKHFWTYFFDTSSGASITPPILFEVPNKTKSVTFYRIYDPHPITDIFSTPFHVSTVRVLPRDAVRYSFFIAGIMKGIIASAGFDEWDVNVHYMLHDKATKLTPAGGRLYVYNTYVVFKCTSPIIIKRKLKLNILMLQVSHVSLHFDKKRGKQYIELQLLKSDHLLRFYGFVDPKGAIDSIKNAWREARRPLSKSKESVAMFSSSKSMSGVSCELGPTTLPSTKAKILTQGTISAGCESYSVKECVSQIDKPSPESTSSCKLLSESITPSMDVVEENVVHSMSSSSIISQIEEMTAPITSYSISQLFPTSSKQLKTRPVLSKIHPLLPLIMVDAERKLLTVVKLTNIHTETIIRMMFTGVKSILREALEGLQCSEVKCESEWPQFRRYMEMKEALMQSGMKESNELRKLLTVVKLTNIHTETIIRMMFTGVKSILREALEGLQCSEVKCESEWPQFRRYMEMKEALMQSGMKESNELVISCKIPTGLPIITTAKVHQHVTPITQALRVKWRHQQVLDKIKSSDRDESHHSDRDKLGIVTSSSSAKKKHGSTSFKPSSTSKNQAETSNLKKKISDIPSDYTELPSMSRDSPLLKCDDPGLVKISSHQSGIGHFECTTIQVGVSTAAIPGLKGCDMDWSVRLLSVPVNERRRMRRNDYVGLPIKDDKWYGMLACDEVLLVASSKIQLKKRMLAKRLFQNGIQLFLNNIAQEVISCLARRMSLLSKSILQFDASSIPQSNSSIHNLRSGACQSSVLTSAMTEETDKKKKMKKKPGMIVEKKSQIPTLTTRTTKRDITINTTNVNSLILQERQSSKDKMQVSARDVAEEIVSRHQPKKDGDGEEDVESSVTSSDSLDLSDFQTTHASSIPGSLKRIISTKVEVFSSPITSPTTEPHHIDGFHTPFSSIKRMQGRMHLERVRSNEFDIKSHKIQGRILMTDEEEKEQATSIGIEKNPDKTSANQYSFSIGKRRTASISSSEDLNGVLREKVDGKEGKEEEGEEIEIIHEEDSYSACSEDEELQFSPSTLNSLSPSEMDVMKNTISRFRSFNGKQHYSSLKFDKGSQDPSNNWAMVVIFGIFTVIVVMIQILSK